MAELPPPNELEGGFIPIRSKVYRGTIRRRDDHRVVWTCKHNHYRPEYNARYTQDLDEVWETSGLNCGRAAYRQHLEGEKVKGDPGLVGDPKFPIALRDDVRMAKVGSGGIYMGRVSLKSNGHRHLSVTKEGTNITGIVNLDVPPSKAVKVNITATKQLREWATAAWLLKGAVWGVVFQDPRVRMESDDVIERAVEELLEADSKPGPKKLPKEGQKSRIVLPKQDKPVRKRTEAVRKPAKSDHPKKLLEVLDEDRASTTEPHIRVGRNSKGRRVFEVVGFSEEDVEQFVHRGSAVKRLAEIKESH